LLFSIFENMPTVEDTSSASSDNGVTNEKVENDNMTHKSPGPLETGALLSMGVSDSEKGSPREPPENPDAPDLKPPYSAFSLLQKKFIVFIVALTTLLPPLTASIFYPVITLLARELHVSITDINLTITIYLVCYSS
jgi:hypothetical protein